MIVCVSVSLVMDAQSILTVPCPYAKSQKANGWNHLNPQFAWNVNRKIGKQDDTPINDWYLGFDKEEHNIASIKSRNKSKQIN